MLPRPSAEPAIPSSAYFTPLEGTAVEELPRWSDQDEPSAPARPLLGPCLLFVGCSCYGNLADFVFPSLHHRGCTVGSIMVSFLARYHRPWQPAPAATTTAGGAMRWPLSLLWCSPKADTMSLSVSGEHFAQPMPLPSTQLLPL